jgi:hypothetical protein
MEKERKVTIAGVNVEENGRDIVWPIFLIFVGTVLLLNSLSIVDWNIWQYLFRFWPVFLILAGMKIIWGNTKIGEIVVGSLTVLVFLGILGFSYIMHTADFNISFLSDDFSENVRNRYHQMFDISRESVNDTLYVLQSSYEDTEELEVSLDIAAVELNITSEEDTENFVSLDASYYEGYAVPSLTEEYSEDTDKLDIYLSSSFPNGGFNWDMNTPVYDVVLSNVSMPYSIDLNLGAGEGNIDFDYINLKTLTADVGAGELEITLEEEEALPSEKLSFSVGAGDVSLNIPDDVGFVLSYTVGVGEIEVNGDSVVSFVGDGTYKSENYGNTDTVVNIDIDLGAGSFSINTF